MSLYLTSFILKSQKWSHRLMDRIRGYGLRDGRSIRSETTLKMLLWTNRLSHHTFTVEIASSNLVGSTNLFLNN